MTSGIFLLRTQQYTLNHFCTLELVLKNVGSIPITQYPQLSSGLEIIMIKLIIKLIHI